MHALRSLPPLFLLGVAFVFSACDNGGDDTPVPRTVPDDAYVTTDSGLKYHDFTVGDGAEATEGDAVTVHYRGWLTDDTQFDASYDRNEPFTFRLGAGQVIQGWDEGVKGMTVGGERQLVIPPELGYGAQGAGDAIPPNATLIFEVELLDVEE
jgi:FKBP-type peptidyl-prolyl cis-trans isomerase